MAKMARHSMLWLTCFLILMPLGTHSWWIFSDSKDNHVDEPSSTTEMRKPVQFEAISAEQKFLAEAQTFLDLPQLDQCQHVVIARLRGSCGEMREEALGKLAVELLNCQSQTEGRPTYPCTQSMTLAECTGGMDASTWNAYHIISNRARSVCYAMRQEHFKRQTEVAVNQLSHSTLQQLSAMQELSSSHQQIKDLTQESLLNVQSQQNELTQRQEELATRQDTVRDKITVNLEQLAKEKTLIRNGQRQLVNMTDSIKLQLEEASSLLSSQEKSRRLEQSEIMEDLTRVRENIQQVWSRVDSSTSQLLEVMGDISDKYKSTLDNLDRINSSVTSMMSLVVAMDTAISGQLEWLVSQLGGAQDGLRVLTLLATHAAFLLLATLCVLFVRAPGFARVTLLLLVSLNVLCELHYQFSLTFTALSALETLIIAGNWLYLWLQSYKSTSLPRQPQPLPGIESHSLLQPNEVWEPELSKLELRRSSTPIPYDDDLPDIETITHTPTKPHTPDVSKPMRCGARTRTGAQCRLLSTPGEVRCRRHL